MVIRGCRWTSNQSTTGLLPCSASWLALTLSTLRLRMDSEAAISGLPSRRCASPCASARSGRANPSVPNVINSESARLGFAGSYSQVSPLQAPSNVNATLQPCCQGLINSR